MSPRRLSVALFLATACASAPTSDAAMGAGDADVARDAADGVDAASGLDVVIALDAEEAADASVAPDAEELVDGGIAPDASAPLDVGSAADASEPLDAAAPDALAPDATAPADGGDALDAAAASLRPFAVEGFGAQTVGGWQPGHDTYVVRALDDSGPGTLREGLGTATGPRVITFAFDGTIALGSALLVPSNVSIDGGGRRIVITGKGFILAGSDEVILRNLTLRDVGPDSEDGVRIGDPTGGASERVVLDHLSFEATADHGDSTQVDEAISVIFGSTDITLAHLRFERWEKVMLFGNGDAPAAVDANMRVTVHHCLARGTGRRHPQARYGIFDLYDNYWDGWHMFGFFAAPPFRESFGVQAQDGARIVVEASLFRRDRTLYDLGSQADDATRCESGGSVEERANQVVSGGSATLRFGVGCPPVALPWQRPYPASVEPAGAALEARLEVEAGATL